jgi:hypothetical protein
MCTEEQEGKSPTLQGYILNSTLVDQVVACSAELTR